MKREINVEKLVDAVQACGMTLPEEVVVIIEDELVPGSIIASVANHQFVVKEGFWPKFCDLVEKNETGQLSHYLEGRFDGIKYIPLFELDGDEQYQTFVGDGESKLQPEVQDQIVSRASGLITGCTYHIKRLAALINKCSLDIASNPEIVKDKDWMLTFDTISEDNYRLQICLDSIDPIHEEEKVIEILRTPMTKEQKALYFGEYEKMIEDHLREVSDYIDGFVNAKLLQTSKAAKDMGISLLNGTILSQFLNLRPMLISFGGRDNWRLFGGESPNSKVCHEIMDKEIEFLVDYLQNKVVLDEGVELDREVDIYSVDMKDFNIYARDKYNQVIGNAIVGASEFFHLRYSEGFMELFKLRLRQSDNRHFFFA